MTLLPILPAWLFWPVAALLACAAGTLLRKGPAGRGSGRAARRRFAVLVLLVLMAAARPGLAGGTVPAAATELNVFFVVDTTPSSAAEDYDGTQTRLAGITKDINAIATELAGARFSLLTFDSTATVALPLTTDATALRTAAGVLSPKTAQASQGSSVSSARGLLARQLAASGKAHPQRPRLVFYLGDGEQTAASAPEPFKEGAGLIDGGAVLGYGTAAGGKMRDSAFGSGAPAPYILDRSTDGGQPAVSVIDEKQLRAIAGQLGVPYVHRVAPAGIGAALADAAPRTAADRGGPEGVRPGRVELYWLPALAAFGVALWELASLMRSCRGLRPRRESAA